MQAAEGGGPHQGHRVRAGGRRHRQGRSQRDAIVARILAAREHDEVVDLQRLGRVPDREKIAHHRERQDVALRRVDRPQEPRPFGGKVAAEAQHQHARRRPGSREVVSQVLDRPVLEPAGVLPRGQPHLDDRVRQRFVLPLPQWPPEIGIGRIRVVGR